MTDSLRDWADTCEARALDALDTSPALAPNVLLEVAMLLDQRADYIEQRAATRALRRCRPRSGVCVSCSRSSRKFLGDFHLLGPGVTTMVDTGHRDYILTRETGLLGTHLVDDGVQFPNHRHRWGTVSNEWTRITWKAP